MWLERVPVLPAAWDYVRAGVAPGGTHANRRFLEDWVDYDPAIGKDEQLLLADAQTSGGMLIAVPRARLEALLDALGRHETPVRAVVGEVFEGPAGRIRVAP